MSGAGYSILNIGEKAMRKSVYARTVLAVITAAGLLTTAFQAQAHTSIWPRESRLGATERYTVRVPSEGKIATTSAELEVPAGVIVEVLSVPNGWKQSVKRENDRIVSIKWEMNIPPGEFLEFGFVARNPREGSELVWTLRQIFADGKIEDFTKGPQGIRPTAVTKLAPRAQ
jgi:uncharacterized protein YcnI